MKRLITAGATDQTVYVFIQDSASTTGGGKTGIAYNAASLVCYYVRDLGSATALTLATQTVTGAHSDGGFVEVDATNMPGIYRLDLSDAVCAASVNNVVVMLKGAAGMVPLPLEIQLGGGQIATLTGHTAQTGDAYARLGAPAGASASADIAAIKAETALIQAKTTNLPAAPASTTNITAATGVTLTATTGLGNQTANITGTVSTVTTVTNQLTAAQIATGVWQDATAGDFTTASSIGKALYVANVAPGGAGGHFIAGTNAATSITTALTANITGNLSGSVGSVTGAVGSVTTVSDKTGYSLTATTGLGNQTSNITGNLSGSVGSVTGAVGSVTGAVGSVTGNVGGNVTGSVGSVAANGITSTSIATDAINANSVKADAVTKIQNGLATPTNITAATGVDITKILGTAISIPATAGILDVNVKNIGNGAVDMFSAGVPLVGLTGGDIGGLSFLAGATVGAVSGLTASNLDATVSSRLASASYTAPLDAAGVRTAVGLATANLDTQLAAELAQATLARKILKNRTETDPVTGIMTVYDDDGTTPLYTANIYTDVAGATPYAGTAGVNRRNALA